MHGNIGRVLSASCAIALFACGSTDSGDSSGSGGTGGASGGSAGKGGTAGTAGGGSAGKGGTAGSSGATSGGTAGSGGSSGTAGSAGKGGSGPLPADPCIAANTCPEGEWINVTPSDIDYPEFGPGPVVVDKGKPSDLYMGGGGDGVWKSTDYGNTWSKINDTIGYVPMGTVLAVIPTDPATVLVAGYKLIHKSTDGGVTYEDIAFDFPDSLYSMEVDPYDNNHVISGLHEVDGIVESFDAGDTWNYVGTSGFPSGGKSWYVFFIDTGVAGTTAESWMAIAQDGGGLTRTTDGGDTWTVPTGAAGLQHAHGNAQIFQSGQNVFVPGVQGPGQGMYRSTDWGATFTKVADGSLSVAWGTDTNVYGMWGWACADCDLGAGFTVAALPGDTWTKPAVPAGLIIGANHMAVTSDGTHNVFVGTMWSSGVWRYVEP